MQEALLAAGATAPFHISHSSADTEGQACFLHSSPYPPSPLSIQDGLVVNQRLKWNLPPGAPTESLWGSILVGVGSQP